MKSLKVLLIIVLSSIVSFMSFIMLNNAKNECVRDSGKGMYDASLFMLLGVIFLGSLFLCIRIIKKKTCINDDSIELSNIDNSEYNKRKKFFE